MSTADFDWTLARSFLAVLDAGSLTAAARRLGMQQPTLSRHIAALEAHLGVALFERGGHGMVATQAALAIAESVRRMQDGAEGVSRTLHARQQAQGGTVRITTSQVAAAHLLPPVLATLREREPGIQVELVASNLMSNLLRREADIAVRMARPTQQSLVARKLGDVGLGVYAHERYLARHGTPAAPTDLLRHTLVGFDRDDRLRRGFARAGLPIEADAFALRSDDHIACMALVAAGAGIGFLAHHTVPAFPGLKRVLPTLAIPPLPCWLAVHREIRGNPVVRRVFDLLVETIPPRLAATIDGPVVPTGAPAAARRLSAAAPASGRAGRAGRRPSG